MVTTTYVEIMENLDNKNPRNLDGDTPLHHAAAGGHRNLCKLIMNNVIEKNPKNNNGKTPRDKAVEFVSEFLNIFEQ